MRVLESPITWIVVAAVLVVVAVVLIVVSGVRRRRARRAAWPPPALEAGRPDPDRTPVSNVADTSASTAGTTYAEPTTDPIDVDAVRAGLAADEAPDAERAHDARRPRHAAAADDPAVVTEATGAPDGAAAAKDRLLAVLLADPQAAIAALTAAEADGTPAGEADVTALLRAGLTPAQVARLVGVGEDRLATQVARGLGLLPGDQVPGGGVSTGENRTDDPGRSWANAASSAGSTTPTTG